mgnify:CR=1 FL=1
MGCETANYLYTRCPEVVSTNCITYQGESIDCLGVCKGMTLTKLEDIVVNKICDLATLTNMSVIDFTHKCPWIATAWNNAHPGNHPNVDNTILNILNFILDELCVLQAEITVLQTPVEPEVTLDYDCCSTNSCVTTGKVPLSVALQNIITCICGLKSEVSILESTVQSLQREVIVLNAQINDPTNGIGALKNQLATQQIDISTLQSTVACIISAFSSQVGTITCP